jgi:hypothetical protein
MPRSRSSGPRPVPVRDEILGRGAVLSFASHATVLAGAFALLILVRAVASLLPWAPLAEFSLTGVVLTLTLAVAFAVQRHVWAGVGPDGLAAAVAAFSVAITLACYAAGRLLSAVGSRGVS